MELLSPCGSMEGAKLAIENGADALYAGMTNLSMRPKRVEFNDEPLEDLVDYIHKNGKHIYITLNVYMKSQDELTFRRAVDEVYNSGADAIIVSDIGAISYIKKHYPDLAVHVSICTSVTNPEAAKFYEEMGADVIVISRSLDDLEEIKKIRAAVSAGLEIFVHGGICYMFDGDCYMSSYWKQEWKFDEDLGRERLMGQNNTKGECQLVCKRFCSLTVDGETLADGQLLRRPDQVGLANIPFYIENGINILKIEGRAMPLNYVAEATALYRQAIDLYLESPDKYRVKNEWTPVVGDLVQARYDYERQWHIR
jgi:putative protease